MSKSVAANWDRLELAGRGELLYATGVPLPLRHQPAGQDLRQLSSPRHGIDVSLRCSQAARPATSTQHPPAPITHHPLPQQPSTSTALHQHGRPPPQQDHCSLLAGSRVCRARDRPRRRRRPRGRRARARRPAGAPLPAAAGAAAPPHGRVLPLATVHLARSPATLASGGGGASPRTPLSAATAAPRIVVARHGWPLRRARPRPLLGGRRRAFASSRRSAMVDASRLALTLTLALALTLTCR